MRTVVYDLHLPYARDTFQRLLHTSEPRLILRMTFLVVCGQPPL